MELSALTSAVSCVIEANVGDEDKLFGSVSNADIQEALSRQGIEIDRKDILLKTPVRKTGAHQVEVRCHSNVKAILKFSVVKKKD